MFGTLRHYRSRLLIDAALASLLLVAMAAAPLAAADMSVKASARANPFAGYIAGKCGMFAGFNSMGVAGAVNNGIPGASIVQGDIGFTLGYGCPLGQVGSFWFAEADFDFANLNGAASGLSMSGPAHFQQKIAIGSPLSQLLNAIPNPFSGLSTPSTPALPSGISAGPQYPFVFASLHEQDISAQLPQALAQGRQWLISPGIGIGLESRLSNGVVMDVTAQWKLDSNAFQVGPQKVSLGNAAVVQTTFKY